MKVRNERGLFPEKGTITTGLYYLWSMDNTSRRYAALAALLMALAVALGALAAHALSTVLTPQQLDSFQTGVRYQAWHALGLLLIQILPAGVAAAKWRLWSSRLMVAGILCFSFSIYLLNLRGLLSMADSLRWLGPITPVGGLLLIAAWMVLGGSLISSTQSVKTTP